METQNHPRAISCTDHLGNQFVSLQSMCHHYGISVALFLYREKQGWSLERSLQEPKNRSVCDHKGTQYPSLSAMCATYRIPVATVQFRLHAGWSLENALTAPLDDLRQSNTTICVDHLGNQYPSKAVMCACYGISHSTFNARIKKGLSLEKALTKKVRTRKSA